MGYVRRIVDIGMQRDISNLLIHNCFHRNFRLSCYFFFWLECVALSTGGKSSDDPECAGFLRASIGPGNVLEAGCSHTAIPKPFIGQDVLSTILKQPPTFEKTKD